MNYKSVTVIMPIRNEAAYIRRSLGSVLAQDYPAECLQVLVVDGQSDDGTRELVQTMIEERSNVPTFQRSNVPTFSPGVRLLDNPGRIVPTGLNIGLAEARGDVIVRVDGHCEIPPDYLSRCVALLEESGADCVGGPIETVGETATAQTIAVAMSSPFGVGGSAFRTVQDRTLWVDTLAFGAYTRAAIERCGAFDEELIRNQDEEYNYRLRKLGGKLLLSSAIRSRYYSRGTLGKLWRQYYQYGYWKVRVLQKHPRQMQARHFAPPLFAAAVLGGALLAPLSPVIRRLGSVVLLLYAVANLVASLLTARRAGLAHLPRLPLIFAILHLSYGLGFLRGLIAFRRRWGREEG
jgi:glycosyltransferase involved in cell wall biosynthesis